MLFKKKNIPLSSEKKPTPHTNASFISKLTYSWMNPIFRIGYNRPLEKTDLYLLGPKFKEEYYEEKFEANWKKEEEIRNKKPSLVRTLVRVFGPKWIPAGTLKLVSDFANLTSPIFLELLLNYITNLQNENEKTDSYKGWVYSAVLFILQMIATISINWYFQLVMEVGLSVRATFIGVIFRKMLKLSQNAKQQISEGQIINLVSTDAARLQHLCGYLHYLWSGPFQLIVILVLLIRSLGVSALVGYLIFVFLIPLQGYVMKWLTKLRKQTAILTDQRVRKTQEIISGMRVIKFFGWEISFLDIINKLRSKELRRIRRGIIINAETSAVFNIIPFLASALTFVTYSCLGNDLTAAKVFSSLSYFSMLRFPLAILPMVFGQLADSVVAIKRLTNLLNGEELDELPKVDVNAENAITVNNGNFKWESVKTNQDNKDKKKTEEEKKTNKTNKKENKSGDITEEKIDDSDENKSDDEKSSTDNFRLYDINLKIPRKSLTAIVGTVGSGKSSLINALIGEMKRESGSIVLGGSTGYCPQQAWIQNATVRDNILFGKEYNKEKYEAAIKYCALQQDLEIFPNGDMTEIGERGINLSGGQKQRINLARAVYFDSDIIFLDDPLSAVDAHVSRYLFDKCILNALSDKTRVLVTHQLHILPKVDYIVCINEGRIVEQGEYSQLMENNGEFSRLMKTYGGIDESEESEDSISDSSSKSENNDDETIGKEINEEKLQDEEEKKELKKENNVIDDDKKDQKSEKKGKKGLMTVEERYTGSISMNIYKSYIKAAGGMLCVVMVLFILILTQISRIGNDMWLVYWTDDKLDLSTTMYIVIYLIWCISQGLCVLFFGIIMAYTGIIAAKKVHKAAIERVMKAPISFFDTTPLGRIINRFSKDQDALDGILFKSMQTFLNSLAATIATLTLMIYATPIFIVALIPLLIIYYIIQEFYRNTSRELKRLDSISRSPLYANFTETMAGISTIRAYREQDRFTNINNYLIDTNNEPCILQITAQRWLALRLETIGAFIVLFAALSGMLLKDSITPSLLGLSLSYALQVTSNLNTTVRQFSETEVNMNSAERLCYYANEIETENQKGLDASKEWPQKGKIEIKNLTMRYSSNLPPVLNDISFNINPMEKIGVVGRTGAGKSSIVMTLFRLVEPESGSKILIDDVDICSIKLNDLRKKISIIPQDPLLFSGTVRFNMDPFNEHDDQEIWNALENAGLKSTISNLENKLDSEVLSNGENFSVGQRQLLCLARAMLRQSRILIMDEATASVDIETDTVIQEALRTEFKNVSVITIAHRLNTIIDYDKVLVLSEGKIIEYDKPCNLLFEKSEDGELIPTTKTEFSKLVDETGPVNAALLRQLSLSASTTITK